MLHMTLQGCTRPELDTWKGWQLCHHMTLQGCTRPELDTWKGWQLCHHMTLQGCTRPELDTWKADNPLLSQQKRDIYDIIAPLKNNL